MKYLYPCKPNPLSPESRYFGLLDNDVRWIAEVKKNGWRCLVEKSAGKVVLWTRHGTQIPEPVPELRESLRGLPDDTVLDGEFVHYRTRTVKGALYLFDILSLEGEPLVNLPLSERRKALESVLSGIHTVELARQVRVGKKMLYSESIEGDENEGIVLKRLDSRYPASETRCLQNPFWLKVKKPNQ